MCIRIYMYIYIYESCFVESESFEDVVPWRFPHAQGTENAGSIMGWNTDLPVAPLGSSAKSLVQETFVQPGPVFQPGNVPRLPWRDLGSLEGAVSALG